MLLTTLALLLSALPGGATGWQAAAAEDPLPASDPAVTRAELEHHVRFLASDELAGRAPLTPGMERAAQYLARALEAAGLEPAGDGGTFFQATGRVRLETPSRPRLLFTLESGEVRELRHEEEFTLEARGRARSTEQLPLRFFYDYNHARMPLEGNPSEALYFSASKVDKRRILKEKGIANLEDWGLELEVLRTAEGRELGEARDPLPSRLLAPDEPEGCERVELRGPVLTEFELRKFTHVQLLVEEVEAPFADRNVVARLRGAGTPERPELAQEVVVLSAHYDHLGVRRRPRGPESADAILNGADDDASGCAALLELAQAFAAGPRPARTLVFLFTTGEESGGTGCRRYLAAPAEPLERTVADLNLEMLGRPDELVGGPGKLWLTGHERTNLGPAWQAQGLAIAPDPRPEQGFFHRSDNYAFALQGIVAQTLSSFGLHGEYHTPRDEPDTLDYAHLESAARLAHQAARSLADGTLAPAWLEGQRPKPREPRGERPEGEPREGEGGRKRELQKLRGGDKAGEDEKQDD